MYCMVSFVLLIMQDIVQLQDWLNNALGHDNLNHVSMRHDNTYIHDTVIIIVHHYMQGDW